MVGHGSTIDEALVEARHLARGAVDLLRTTTLDDHVTVLAHALR